MTRRSVVLSTLALATAGAFLLWRVAALVSGCDDTCSARSGLQGTAATVVVVAFIGAVVTVAWWRRRVAVVAVTCVAALVAAAPVSAGWNDGCNDHGSTSALGIAVVHAVTTPEDPRGAFGGTQTLMACYDGPLDLPR